MNHRAFSVLMVGTDRTAPGGITAVVNVLLTSYLSSRFSIEFVSTYSRPGLIFQLKFFGLALLKIIRALWSGRIELVHVHSASRGSFWRKSIVCALARMRGVPYVFHLHSGEFPVFFENECGFISKYWVRCTLRKASVVLVLTESWKRVIERMVPQSNVVVLPNAVQASGISHGVKDAKKVLFLGRLREKKGVFDLIEAIPAILNLCPDTHFVLAGDGDLERASKRVTQLGVANHVTLTGWIDGEQKEQALATATVLVLPSYFEGFPVCILEAMAHRVAVVASAVGGIPDVLEGGRCGRLIEPGSPEVIAAGISELLVDDEKRHEMAEKAYQRFAKNYSLECVLEALVEVYKFATKSGG